MFLRLYIIACLFALGAEAAEVLRVGKDSSNIAVTHDRDRQWKSGDRVCVLQRAHEVACGGVVKSTTKGAIVKLDAPNYDVMAGDKVISKFLPQKAAAAGAPLLNSVQQSPDSEAGIFNISGGINFGTTFFYPVVNFSVAVSPTISLGLTGLFLVTSSNGINMNFWGGYATVSYYSQEYFRGLWLQGGLGMMIFTTDDGATVETTPAFTGLVTAGWRGYWDLGLNVGAGLGLQYIYDPTTTPTSYFLKPMVTVDIGFNF